MPVDQDIELKCRVYNGYDLDTETETLTIPALQGKKSDSAENAEQTENISQDITVSGQETEGLSGETGEAVEASGSVHEINMGWYERKDAEKESEKILVNRSDISQFLWLMILGLLVALLILLIITRSVFRKKQKRARYRGRRR